MEENFLFSIKKTGNSFYIKPLNEDGRSELFILTSLFNSIYPALLEHSKINENAINSVKNLKSFFQSLQETGEGLFEKEDAEFTVNILEAFELDRIKTISRKRGGKKKVKNIEEKAEKATLILKTGLKELISDD